MSPFKKADYQKDYANFEPMSGLFNGRLDERSEAQVLEDFLLRNPELGELEALLDRFNIFEAMRAERTEVRHSDFLAFLLDPGETHGLDDAVLKSVLQAVLKSKGDYPPGVTPVDLDAWDLTTAQVSREEANIDILVRYQVNGRKLLVIIENKIDSSEHDDQLARYYDRVLGQNPDAQLIAVYLTPEGDPPTDERYLPLDYGVVARVLSGITEHRQDQLGESLKLALEHYVGMLRRHIVAESEVARLAKIICEKHRRAVDIIFEHRPDARTLIMEQLCTLIKETPGLTLARFSKSHVSFLIDKIANLPRMQDGDPNYYIGDRRCFLYIEFNLSEDNVGLRVVVGPGPIDLRTKLVEKARTKPEVFSGASGSLGSKFKTILGRKVLSKNDMISQGPVTIPVRVNSWWSDFRDQTLPAIIAAFDGFKLK